MNHHPIAIAISDLHLSLLQPACRADKDWLEVQAGYLQQIKDVINEFTPTPERFPILCAGDIFDRWNAPPELINFALEHLPDNMICVPGQHDLPLHRTDLMHRSGYGVLKQVEKIKDLSEIVVEVGKGLVVSGFGWDETVEPAEPVKGFVHIALIHRYVWTENKKYLDAPDAANIVNFRKQLKGYDVAVFGDNHIPFLGWSDDCRVINCGTFIRRKSDEIDYQPSVGIIYSDGTVQRKKLDTSGDRFHEHSKDRPEVAFNMKEFIESLEELGEHGLDFRAAVERHLIEDKDLSEHTREIILAALDNKV